MSDQSTKEIEERDRFAPSYEEKQRAQKRLMVEWFLESDNFFATCSREAASLQTIGEMREWIAEETGRRIAEHCEEHMPIINGRVKR